MTTSTPTPHDGGKQEQTPRTMPVEYIESGTFVGGEEDAFNFDAREKDASFVVIREADLLSSVNSIAGMREANGELSKALQKAIWRLESSSEMLSIPSFHDDDLRATLARYALSTPPQENKA